LQEEEVCREPYIKVLSLTLSLIKQQCKAEWIKFGDECTRYFFAKAKQRKLATYIYTLQDQNGESIEGFKAVATKKLQFYKKILGKQ